jgi:PAS domain S-box-containing protein
MGSLTEQTDALPHFQTLLDERVLDLPDRLLDLLPVGVYVCDRAGLIVRYNNAAADLWGCSPSIGDPTARFCGSYRLYRLDGEHVPHAKCPMADVLASGRGLRDQEIAIERPDGTRIVALVNIEAIKDSSGGVVGAVNVFRKRPEQQHLQPDLNDRERDSDQLLQALPTAVYTTDAAGRITFYNDAAVELWGVRPDIGNNEFCGSWKLYWPDGTPLPHGECPMALALKERRPIRGMEAIAERPDGTRVPFMAYPTPLFDASGALAGAVNMLVDITDRRQAEMASEQLAAIVESSDDCVLTKDLNGIITSWNRGSERLFGYTAEEAIGKPVTILMPADRQDEEAGILARIRRGERIDHYETIRRRKDGSGIDISLTVSPLKNSKGEIIGASKIARDIGERRRAQEQQHLLLREMDHRVKNLFALSSGVVALSARSATTPEELASAVQERLAALARAHALTLPKADGAESRAERSTTLHALIETISSPYNGRPGQDRARVAVRGVDVPIVGGLVTSFALLLHEFATNAAKYGALSTPAGYVDVECSENNGLFVLTWKERGGPRVEHPGNGEGFGTLLGHATVKEQLGGEISRDWNPEGLKIRLSIARERLTA